MSHFQRLCLIASVVLLRSLALADEASDPGNAEPPSAAAAANPLASWSLDRLSATRDRPLFAPTRRVPPPPPPPPPVVARIEEAPPAPPPNLVLLGIITEGKTARAMVRTNASNKVVRARLGDDIGGWKVTQIEPRRLVLSNDDRSVSFALFSRAGSSAAASALAGMSPDPQVQNVAEERIDRRTGRR
jgi:general secretion pathway protein N